MGNVEKFNHIANQYDTPERIEIANIIATTIRTYLGNNKGKIAIDYGCGTGLVGMQLLDDFQSIIFIDASNNMVEQVNQKINQQHIKNATALCCDFTIQCPTELCVDYVILTQTLIHIKEVEPILSSLYNILNKDGHLLIVDFDKNNCISSDEVHNGFEQEGLTNIIKKIGFIKADAKTFYHGRKIFMNKDASLFILDAMK